nr:unnamed protein product [Spirometra erinaceieuropaei]
MVETILDSPLPASKPQLQRFLDMINLYLRFLPNCADLILPPTNMLSQPKGPHVSTGDSLTVIKSIKASLTDATSLTHPTAEAPLSLLILRVTSDENASKLIDLETPFTCLWLLCGDGELDNGKGSKDELAKGNRPITLQREYNDLIFFHIRLYK